ncbi:hypothetical protein ACWKWV_04680 [Castellaniella ginsengisoli]
MQFTISWGATRLSANSPASWRSPKSLTEKLHKMGIPILGAQAVAPGVTRGGLVELKQILVRGLYQPQINLLDDDPPVHQFEESAVA